MGNPRNWAKLDALLWSNPKILRLPRRERWWAGIVFKQLLLINRAHRCDGEIPASLADPAFLAAACHLEDAPFLDKPPHDLIRFGLRAATRANLIAGLEDGPGCQIVGWGPEWSRSPDTSTERVRRYRARQKAAKEAEQQSLPLPGAGNGETDVTDGNAGNGVTHIEERRGEERDPTDPPSEIPEGGKEEPEGKPKAKRAAPEIPEMAHTLAQLLADFVVENVPGSVFAHLSPKQRAARVIKWADVVRLMHSQDGHSWVDIEGVINWCQRDDFWRTTVQSAEGLRRNWDAILGARIKRGNGKPKDVRVGRAEPASREEWEREPEEGVV